MFRVITASAISRIRTRSDEVVVFLFRMHSYLKPSLENLLPNTAHAVGVGAALGVLVVVDDDVGDAATISTDLAVGSGSTSVEDIPGAKVSKSSSTTAKLNDPFGVVEAERAAHVLVRSGDGHASSQILKRRSTRVVRGGIDAHADVIAGLDGES